jgi:PAS domain S-box-containing protein
LAETLPQLIWMTDGKGTYEYASHQWNEYSGLDPQAENFWQELVHAEDMETMMSSWRRSLASGETYRTEARLKNKNGIYRWHYVTGEPVRNEHGEVTNWIGALTDIHVQKTFAQKLEAEVSSRTAQLLLKNEELQEQKEFIETILDSSEDIIAVLDKDFNYLSVNKKVEQHYGLSKEAFTGKNLFEIFPDLKNGPMPGLLQRAFNGESFSINEYKSAVTNRWYQSYYVPLKKLDGSVYGVVVVGHDITDVMAAAERLREKNIELQNAQSFLQQLIDSSVEFISVLDKNLDYITVNKKFEETLNRSREDLRGRSAFEVNPRLRGAMQSKCLERALQGEIIYLDKRPSVIRPDIYVDTYFIPLRLQDKIEGVIIMARDVTAVVQTEKLLEQKNQELVRSNEDLQQFAHVASHDLKEPVRKIRTFGSRLHAEFNDQLPQRAIEYISKMENAASRMYDMIDGVLLYSSLTYSEQTLDKVDLNQTIRNIESDFELLIEQKKATIICDELPVIHGSSVLLYQLFSNLVNNSLKFSRPGHNPVVHIRANRIGEEDHQLAEITIEDNGIGFNPEQSEKIFKTFSRLHSREMFEGTGLGLALCKKIVERHGGQISAESQEGKGSKFRIVLPLRKITSLVT